MIGIKFSSINTVDELIIDGHHRYIASQLANFNIEKVPSKKTSVTTEYDWNLLEYDTEDWDTQVKIKMLNENDAKFNNLPLEKIIDLLK